MLPQRDYGDMEELSLLHQIDKVPRHGSRFREATPSYCCSVFFHNHPRPYPSHFPGPCKAMMRLSQGEMVQLSQEEGGAVLTGLAQIMSSTHVMTTCNSMVSKIVYSPAEKQSLHIFTELSGAQQDRLIQLKLDVTKLMKCGGVSIYHYPKVKYSPLKREDAKRCLGYLVREIRLCIAQLHTIVLSHNDVQLENICFDDRYKAVFIDVDRCWPLAGMHPMFTSSSRGTSCIYSVPNLLEFAQGKTDYYQLGWLVAWVLDTSTNYHRRTWHKHDVAIKTNHFIAELIGAGNYNDRHLEEAWFGIPLQTVLQEQEMY